jgi:hypothetical protein
VLPEGGQIEAGESVTDPVLKKVCLEHSISACLLSLIKLIGTLLLRVRKCRKIRSSVILLDVRMEKYLKPVAHAVGTCRLLHVLPTVRENVFLLAHLAMQNYSSVALVKSQSEGFIKNSECCENYKVNLGQIGQGMNDSDS